MSDVALQQVPGVYEPSLFGTYSKKIGMWLFLLSDSLTFGALLYAYTYGRISTPNWPTPFHSESIRNATFMTAFLLTSSLTMVFAGQKLRRHDALDNPTVLIVVDRRDLKTQLSDDFDACDYPNVEKAL
jgi:hypothetical protein